MTNARRAGEVEWNLRLRQSWTSTSKPCQGVVPRMDGDSDDLIAQLCTRIGMIMEDANTLALTIGSFYSSAQLAAIGELETAATRIASLIAAVRALSDVGD